MFTYEAGEVEPVVGGRVVVPFGKGGAEKRLFGIVTRVHREPLARGQAKRVLQVLDSSPVLDESLLALGRWIARYYLAPLGEVYRGMLPLQAEFRPAFGYRITEFGCEALKAASTVPLASCAVTVNEPLAPGFVGLGKPATFNSGSTTMPVWLPVMVFVTVSVAVRDCVPVVLSVPEKTCTPASAATKA